MNKVGNPFNNPLNPSVLLTEQNKSCVNVCVQILLLSESTCGFEFRCVPGAVKRSCKKIHPSMFRTAYRTEGRRESGAYHREPMAQGRGHPGRAQLHTFTQISVQQMSLDWGGNLYGRLMMSHDAYGNFETLL